MSKPQCIKVTLSTGKVVLMRDLKISHTELAAQEVAPKSNGDANVLQILMQKALLKNLLIAIDGRELSLVEREDMDSLLTVSEYTQMMKVVGKLLGGDEAGKSPQLEIVNSGGSLPGSAGTQA